jgi:hypothetical protein
MAAKAKSKPSTGGEIWLDAAVKALISTYGSEDDAERMLIAKMAAGDVPYTHMLPDGTRVSGAAVFFRNRFVFVDRKQNRAHIGVLISNTIPSAMDIADLSSPGPTKMFGIKVSHAAVLALRSGEVVDIVSAKTRIEAEARRMKQHNEIPAGIRKTHFARLLADRVGVTPKYVSNHLTEWGLWPISDIK